MKFEILFSLFFLLLGVRTACWWMSCWQIREYRWDRLRTYLWGTHEGTRNIFNLWFFKGILPRPKFSGRIFMIAGIFVFLSGFVFAPFSKGGFGGFLEMFNHFPLLFTAIIWERTIWFSLWISVLLSRIPVFIAQRILFAIARHIVQKSEPITRIGITGSFGKSSTKEILVHLLISKFGKENVLYNPENQNNEVAIARLILKNRKFFENPPTPPLQKGAKKKKFFVAEIGAYRRGEIRRVCRFFQPHVGIITGLNSQHIALFGSEENIKRAKFELAESVSEKVFFNADNALLQQIFRDREIKAVKIPLSFSTVKNVNASLDKTEFSLYGEAMTLPWPGEFFVQNALLASETARECGLSPREITDALRTLPPLPKALSVRTHSSGATILSDIYSANPDGVLEAIKHLKMSSGKKIFVSIPLFELGPQSESVHKKIFEALALIKADVFWIKKDFAHLGEKICGEHFHGENIAYLKKTIRTLEKGDMVLLESRLPKDIMKLFE